MTKKHSIPKSLIINNVPEDEECFYEDAIVVEEDCVAVEESAVDDDRQQSAVERLRSKYKVKFDWHNVVAGAYEAKILHVTHDESGEHFNFPFDIAKGEYKGVYSASDVPEWVNRAPVKISTNWGFERLVKMLQAISESNPGFDATQSFYNEDWNSFIGKRVGVVLQEREYIDKNKELASSLNVLRFIPIAEVPGTPVPPIKHLPKDVK